jgi:hypothetical protein
MDFNQILTIFAVIATNLGTVLAMYINLDKRLEENRKETNNILNGIQQEIKDFHGILCAIEERYRSK